MRVCACVFTSRAVRPQKSWKTVTNSWETISVSMTILRTLHNRLWFGEGERGGLRVRVNWVGWQLYILRNNTDIHTHSVPSMVAVVTVSQSNQHNLTSNYLAAFLSLTLSITHYCWLSAIPNWLNQVGNVVWIVCIVYCFTLKCACTHSVSHQ